MATVSSTYRPPRFTDEQRLKKIEQILPMIKNAFQKEFDGNHYPALAYGVVVDGKLIDAQTFGYIDVKEKIPSSPQSLFRIASMTKSITAMAIVKLRDDGKLRLDDPVLDYIPQLKATDMLTSDAPILTIRHLLTQDAGMPEDDPWADLQLSINDDEFLAMLNKGISMSNPPGTVWEYTNLCFALLGRIISLVSGKPYQKYINEEILQPLGMTKTCWEFSDVPSDLLVRGYRWENDGYVEEGRFHDGVYGAMGGLISSIEDFSKYVSFHLQAWPARSDPEIGPLRRSSLREMHHPWNFIDVKSDGQGTRSSSSAYCYGLVWSKNSDGVIFVNHTGGLPGFGSNWVFLPEHGIGLVSFANRTYADLGRINFPVLDQIFQQIDLKRRELPISDILRQRQEQLLKILGDSKWHIDDWKIFSENFFVDQSLEIRKRTTYELGPIEHVGVMIPKNQLRARFDVECSNGKARIDFSLSPENPPLIQELKIEKIVEHPAETSSSS